MSQQGMASLSGSVATISTQSTRRAPPRKTNEVRQRLLNNLGIFNGKSTNNSVPDPAIERKIKILRGMGLGGFEVRKISSTSSTDINSTKSKLACSVTVERLKYKDDSLPLSSSKGEGTRKKSDSLWSSSKEEGAKNSDGSRSRRICFDDSVSVLPIPMRSEYSDRVRSRLWSNRYEIHENATRNATEFAAEGWDWRHVTEDEGMFVCTTSGELIHPVHCHQ